VRTWRLLTLSTGETPVRSVIESEGQRVRGGQLVRMVDIPAIDPDGRGVIEEPRGQEEAAAFVAALKRACADHYGSAGPAFVRALIDEGAGGDLRARLREQLDRTAQDLLRPHQGRFPRGGVPEEIGRVARRFALADVAGRLACEARILPFTAEEVRGAVAAVFARWLVAYGHGGDMGRALAQLRDFILRNGARFRDRDNSEQVVHDLAGYRGDEGDLYLFTPEGMREALDGYAAQDVVRHLFNNGWLDRPERGNRFLCNFRVAGFDRPLRLYGVRAAFLAHVGESNVDTAPTVPGGNGGNGGNSTA
jgi:putative DNA primase/helicase